MTIPSPKPRPPFVVDARIRRMIAGAVAEIDLAQIAMLRQLTPAERFQQAVAMIGAAERVAAYRLQQRQPNLTSDLALLAVRRRSFAFREQVEEQWRRNQ